MQILSIEQQQILLESSASLSELLKNLESTPMYFISFQNTFNGTTGVTVEAKLPELFEPLKFIFDEKINAEHDVLTLEQQQSLLEESQTLEQFLSNLRNCPMFKISNEYEMIDSRTIFLSTKVPNLLPIKSLQFNFSQKSHCRIKNIYSENPNII